MKKLFFNFAIVLVISMAMVQNSPSYANNNGEGPNWGAQEGARAVKNQGEKVNLMGLAMAAMFASQCGPQNKWACIAAGLSAMDAMAAGKTSSNGYATCNSYGGNCGQSPGGNGGDGNSGDGGDGDGSGDGNNGNGQAKQILKSLEGQGYTFNPKEKSVTTPGGQNLTANDLGSEESMMNKGFSAGQAAQAMENIADIKTKAMDKVMGGEEEGQQRGLASVSGGMGGAMGSASDLSSLGGGGDVYVDEEVYGKKKKKKKEKEINASQLSKNFNGQPIGVGMANLFKIVSEKYKEKRKRKNQFINKEY